MTSPMDLHGPLPEGREGWRYALVRLITPAVERAALGPGRQPAAASMNDPRATWWELVTRPLWGLAALTAGEAPGRIDATADEAAALWASLRETIGKAVDPKHEWYVGQPDNRDQKLVESAAVGYALVLASRKLWEPLNDRQRQRLGEWLAAASAAEPVDNNWHFFPVLAGCGLDAVGFHRDASTDSAHLNRIDEFYKADGWYEDGPTDRYDYYNPFGFHFYNVLLGRGFDGRLARFAQGFQYWFAADGSSIPFGRSLGYRMAQGAFWGALAYAGVEALPWGRIRGLAQRHLEWWWRQPILDGDGLLSVGYRYPNSAIVEQYFGGGSPYWATKFFLPLALTPDHPFWAAEIQAGEDGLARLPGGIVQRSQGEAVLLNGQSAYAWGRGGQAKYAKFAYSTRSGFSVGVGEHSLEHGAFDNMLALTDDDGQHWRAREAVAESRIYADAVYSRWLPWPDVQVETWLIPRGQWHLRVHRLRTARALRSAEGGFCQPHPLAGADSARTADTAARTIQDVGGDRDTSLITPVAGTNVLHPRTVLPMLLGLHEPGEHLLRCAVYQGGGDDAAWSAPDLESIDDPRWAIAPRVI